MAKIDPAKYQKRLDRMTELFAEMVQNAERQAEIRCPYRDRHDECTAGFRCRNQGPPRDGRVRAACGHDGRFDYRGAWESDPNAYPRAKERLGRIRDEAAERRGGRASKAEPR
jgi:hypothetical protein